LLLLAALAASSMAAQSTTTFGPGQQLIVTFGAKPNTANSLVLNSSGALSVAGSPLFTTSLYDGATLLGTYTGAQLQATFLSPGAVASVSGTAIPLTAVNAGTIAGKLVTTVSGGSVSGIGAATMFVYDQDWISPSNPKYLTDITVTGVTVQTVADPPPTPAIASLTPNSAAVGGPAFTLIVGGSGFVAGASVQFSGVPLVTSFVSATRLTASVPAATLAASSGSATVTVLNPGGVGSNAVTFDLGFGPGAQLVVAFTTTPNTAELLEFDSSALTMTGSPVFTTSLYDGQTLLGTYTASPASQGVSGLCATFASQEAGSWVSSWYSPTRIPFTAFHAGTIAGKLVTTVSGGSVSGLSAGKVSLSYVIPNSGYESFSPLGLAGSVVQANPTASPTPAIGSLSPNSAAAGGSAFTLTVNGSGFVSGASVQWNGVPLATSFVSATQLTAAVSADLIASPADAAVTVLNPGGAGSAPMVFSLPFGPGDQLVVTFTAASNQADLLFLKDADDALTITGSPVFTTSLYDGQNLLGTFTATPQNWAKCSYPGGAPCPSTFLSVFASPLGGAGASGYRPTHIPFTSIDGGTIAGRLVTTVSGGSVSGLYLAHVSLSDAVSINAASSTKALTDVTTSSAIFQRNLSPPPGPMVAGLSRTSAAVGAPGFTLTVNGSGFVSGATVLWNGVPLTTSFVSATQLTAIVPAASLAVSGRSGVTVLNPGEAGSSPADFNVPFCPGDRLTETFTAVPNKADLLVYFNNDSLTVAGSPVFTTSLYDGQTPLGTYTAGPYLYNGVSSFLVDFVSPNSPLASVASYVQAPFASIDAGTIAGRLVTTVSGGCAWGFNVPGLGLSDAVSYGQGYVPQYDVTVSGQSMQGNSAPPPAPSITSLSPNYVVAGSKAFSLQIDGSGFVSSATVLWDGVPLSTSFVSANQVTGSVPATQIASAGTAAVAVLNSGGTPSTSLGFDIVSQTAPMIAAVVNGADFASEAFSAGAWITVLGQNFGTAATAGNQSTTLGGAGVTVCGADAILSYNSGPVTANGSTGWQINVLLPDSVAGHTSCDLVVTVSGQSSEPETVTIQSGIMELFRFSSSAGTLPLITHADYSLVGPASAGLVPAKPNESVIAWGTGDCALPSVTSAGKAATVQYSGRVAAGLCQINFVVPANAPGSNQLRFSTSPNSYAFWVSQ
jgi:uncharacterized protein (TIGR03437 family)